MENYNDEQIKIEINKRMIFIIDQINYEPILQLIFDSKEKLQRIICLLKEVYNLYDKITSYNKGLINIHNTLIFIEEVVEINNKYYDESID